MMSCKNGVCWSEGMQSSRALSTSSTTLNHELLCYCTHENKIKNGEKTQNVQVEKTWLPEAVGEWLGHPKTHISKTWKIEK